MLLSKLAMLLSEPVLGRTIDGGESAVIGRGESVAIGGG